MYVLLPNEGWPVVCSPQVHIWGQDSDTVAKAKRSHLWEYPSLPYSIVSPIVLNLDRKEGKMLKIGATPGEPEDWRLP